MDERRIKLIKSGVKLFANKGFHQTSIQDIATEAGISKGAFYLYFDSKATFIGTIFEYFHIQIIDQIEMIRKKELPPKERLAEQISVFINYIDDYKAFIIMQLHEKSALGNNINELIEKIKIDHFSWMYDNIKAIYGDDIKRYIIDIVIQLEGLIFGYLKWIVIDHIDIDKTRVGTYLVRRIDDIVEGILIDNDEQLVKILVQEESTEQQVSEQLFIIKRKINDLSIKNSERDNLHEVVDTILKKVGSYQNTDQMIIQGLLVHLQRQQDLESHCETIANLLDIELLR